jgi:predicted outer membrane repeat protein
MSSGSSATLTNVTFSGNSAQYQGGGMFNSYSSPTLTNATFSGNDAASSGGAMYNYSSSAPQIRNSIFWANTANGSPSTIQGSSAISDSLLEGG